MKFGLCLLFALIAFELALAAVGSPMGERAIDVPPYDSNSQHIVTEELSNTNISDNQSIPNIFTIRPGEDLEPAIREPTFEDWPFDFEHEFTHMMVDSTQIPEYIVEPRIPTNYCSICIEKSIESFNANRYKEAMDFLNETIKICPNSAEAWYKRGYIKFQLMCYDEALYDFSMATELDKTNADYWAFKGIVLYEKEKYYEALAALDYSLNINPDNSYSRNWTETVLKSIE